MSLDHIVNLQISVSSRAPTEPGFGTPLIFGYHEAWIDDLVREYSEPDEMLDDGFDTDHYLYKCAQVVKSQDPSVTTFKIGRRVSALTQIITLQPTVTTEGYQYKGTIGGKAFSYVVQTGETTATVAAAIAAAINALAAGTTATTDASGSVTGTETAPFALANGDTLLVAIDADVPGSPDTATFSATAAVRECANAETYNLDDGMTLTVRINGGTVQTITFNTANFVDINAATAEEVAAVINGQLEEASASATSSGTKVTISSDRKGTSAGVNVTGGTANAVLGFTTGNTAGTGNVADIDAVTIAEAKTIIEAAVSGCTVSDDGTGKLKITSDSSGASSKVLVAAASTADDEFGLDNATHTGTAAGSLVTCTADEPGTVVDFDFDDKKTPPSKLKVKDITADTTTDNELPTLVEEDDDWYGLVIADSSSKATTLLGAAWIETKTKQFFAQTSDTEVLDDGVEDDVLSTLASLEYEQTYGWYHRAIGGGEWLAAGILAITLASDPGTQTPAFKTVVGVRKDKLKTGEENALFDKNGSDYTLIGGIGVTFEGKAGSGQFADVVRFIHWIYVTMRLDVLGMLASNPKVPFTDKGVQMLKDVIMARLIRGQGVPKGSGGFAEDPAPEVTAPKVADVPVADRQNRRLPDVKWKSTLSGALHNVDITGTVSV